MSFKADHIWKQQGKSEKENPVSLAGPELLWLEAPASQLLPEWGRKVPWGTGLSQLLSPQATPTCCYDRQGPGFATPGDLPVLHSPETKGGAGGTQSPHAYITYAFPLSSLSQARHSFPVLAIPAPSSSTPHAEADTPSLVQTEDSSTPALPRQ